MRSLSIVCLFVLLAFGQSRHTNKQILDLLEEYRRDIDDNSVSENVNRKKEKKNIYLIIIFLFLYRRKLSSSDNFI